MTWVFAALLATAVGMGHNGARAEDEVVVSPQGLRLPDANPQDVQSHVQRMMQERYKPLVAVPPPRRRLMESPSVVDRADAVAMPPVVEKPQSASPSAVRIWGKPVSSTQESQFSQRSQQQMQEVQDLKSSAARLAQEKVGDYPIRPRRLEPLTDLLPKPFVPLAPAVPAEADVAAVPAVPPDAEGNSTAQKFTAQTPIIMPQPVIAPSTPPSAASIAAMAPVPAPATTPLVAPPQAANNGLPQSGAGAAPVEAARDPAGEQNVPAADPLRPVNFGMVAASALTKAVEQPPASSLTPPSMGASAAMPLPTNDTALRSDNHDRVLAGGVSSDLDFIKKLVGNNGVIAMDVANSAVPTDVQEAVRLDEAVAFALKNNFEIHASSEKSRGSYWDKMGAYAQFVPSVEMSYSYGAERSSPSSVNDQNGDRLLDNTHHRRDRNMSVRQPLIDLAILADIRTGIDKEDIAKIDEIDVREGIASDTTSVFLKLMQARIAVRLAEQYKQYLDDLATRMEARVSGGGGTMADLDRIRSRATVAESAKVEATGDYESSLMEFRRLTKIVPAQLAVPDVLAPSVPESVDAALQAAMKSNPSYLSSLKKIDVAADDRNKSMSTMLPKLSLQYQKNFSYNAGGSAQGNPVDGVYPNQLTESVMLVAQWSLNSGTPITSSLSSMAKKREMRFRADDTRARLEQALRAAFTAVNAANQREEIVRKSVEANERVVAGFEDQYRQGGRSLFELLDAYEQLYNSRLNLLRLIVAKAQAMYQIRKQMGELIPSIIRQTRQ